jgi:CubicO group peptidase (beta-lactamase class C family)
MAGFFNNHFPNMKTIFLSLLTCLTFGLSAQTLNTEKLDSLFDLIAANSKGMGSISLSNAKGEIYARSIGFADMEKGIKVHAGTKYRIGSISKMFTATVIMQLVDEGKLKLSDSLANFFPAIPNANKITVEQMLRHQSGLFNVTSAEDYLTWNTSPISKQEMLDKIAKNGSIFQPGEQQEYSNTNYILLSFIAEGVTNTEFPELLQERIIKKCGLQNTYYGDRINSENNEAYSYFKKDNWEMESETDMSIPQGAGGVVSTPHDLNAFLKNLFGGKLTSATSLEAMKTIDGEFGLGMFTLPFHENLAYGHTGAIDGFASQAFYFPADDLTLSYISNAVDFSPNTIAVAILSEYFGKEWELPNFTVFEMDAAALNIFTGTYSSPDIPLKLDIFTQENRLMAQATGQAAFPMEATSATTFKFDPAGIVMEFLPEENKMLLKQGGMVMNFER